MRIRLWMLMMSRTHRCSHSRHTLVTSLQCHQIITQYQAWFIVFCRHTNAATAACSACSHHLDFEATHCLWAQVSLWRWCLFRTPMTGWWHEVATGQQTQVHQVYRGTLVISSAGNTSVTCSQSDSWMARETALVQTRPMYHQAALLPRPWEIRIDIYLKYSREKIV